MILDTSLNHKTSRELLMSSGNDFRLYVLYACTYLCVLVQNLVLMNSRATGLPPGIFEANVDDWKKIRNITQPAFSKTKLAKVLYF